MSPQPTFSPRSTHSKKTITNFLVGLAQLTYSLEVISFLVKYCLDPQQRSLLIFCPLAYIFNSTKAHNMCYIMDYTVEHRDEMQNRENLLHGC